jgi:hypothetical protein
VSQEEQEDLAFERSQKNVDSSGDGGQSSGFRGVGMRVKDREHIKSAST